MECGHQKAVWRMGAVTSHKVAGMPLNLWTRYLLNITISATQRKKAQAGDRNGTSDFHAGGNCALQTAGREAEDQTLIGGDRKFVILTLNGKSNRQDGFALRGSPSIPYVSMGSTLGGC